MHLLYITFGDNNKNHTQAYFSVYSFLAKDIKFSSINIITDKPLYYKSIENRINIIEVDSKKLEEWKGDYGFFWRIKIKAIELICQTYPGEPVLYLDSDTFLFGASSKIDELALTKKAMMFENEGPLQSLRSKTMRTMTRHLKGMVIAGIANFEKLEMWNAGVVFTPNTLQQEEVRLALTICDEMCRHKVKDQFVEQFALSVALHSSYTLQPASGFIAHYWSNKEEWNELIRTFFIESKMMNLSFGEELVCFRKLNLEQYPVVKISKNTNFRLKRMIDKLFGDKKVAYIGPGK